MGFDIYEAPRVARFLYSNGKERERAKKPSSTSNISIRVIDPNKHHRSRISHSEIGRSVWDVGVKNTRIDATFPMPRWSYQ
jgi:hypothetical protein